jgi:AraC-like DNA-binding protein
MNKIIPLTYFFNKYTPVLILLLVSYLTFGQSQIDIDKIDSLSKLDYKTLNKNIFEKDSTLSILSANAFLKKAKSKKDTFKILYGFNRFIYQKKKTSYVDSIISLLKDNKNEAYRDDLSTAFFSKGAYFYDKYDFQKSLDNYIAAGRIKPGYDIDMSIGLIKNRIGEYKEALKLFKKGERFLSKNPINNDYLFNLFAISDTYRHLKKLDSASYYNSLGYNLSVKNGMSDLKPYFILNEAANNYDKKKYKESLDSLLSVSKSFIGNGDSANLAMNYYFSGMSAYQLKQKNLAVKHLKKLDSIYVLTNHLEPEFRKGYEALIHISSSNNDLEGQLKYINRLLRIDSSLTKDYKLISKNLFQNYDTPKLLEEKQKTIIKINKQNNKFSTLLKISLLVLILLAMYSFYKNKKNKQKFHTLIKKNNQKEIVAVEVIVDKTQKLQINQDVIDDILIKIKAFEKGDKFIQSDITLIKLAKRFNTNSKYLSQIINHYRGKNFSNYINSLRIDYAVNQLKNDTKYSIYTIKAIANEFGFNSTASFTSAFLKNTGINASYFLKELKK